MADDSTTGPAKAKAKIEAKAKKAKSTAKAKTKRKAKARTKPKAKAKARTKTKPKARTKAKAKARPKSKTKARTKTKAKAKARTKTKAKSRTKAKALLTSEVKATALLDTELEALALLGTEVTTPALLEVEVPAEAPKAFRTPEPETLPDLPVVRGRDFILAMVRDPESAFIYWELTPEGAARARATLGEQQGTLTLRVYVSHEDGSDTVVHDHSVNDWIGRFEFRPGQAGRKVVAALGFKAHDAFAHVSRATAVQLPRRWPGTGAVAFSKIVENSPKPQAAPAPRLDAPPRFGAPAFSMSTRPAVASRTAFHPVPVAYELKGINAAALVTFKLEQAVGAEGAKSDLQHIWGSNHLLPSSEG
jgi:hypothetical protein